MSAQTKTGRKLELLNLKGKDYLPVAQRLVWFREEHPMWGIETEFNVVNEKYVLAKATIKDDTGRVLATGHKREDFAHFADATEKCETGAIGRALGILGYGTQFTTEFDEGDRIVDAPQTPRLKSTPTDMQIHANDPHFAEMPPDGPEDMDRDTTYRLTFGKWKGQSIAEIGVQEAKNYANYLISSAKEKGEEISHGARDFTDALRRYIDKHAG